MSYVNKYLRNIVPYKVASHKIWDVPIEYRQRILKLDWNEATIAPSPLVQKYLADLVNKIPNYNLYPSTYNIELHNLFANYAEVPKENIQYFASSDVLHEYIVRAYTTVGDTVLILSPTYDNFRLTCETHGGKVKFSEFQDDFIFSEEDFDNDIHRTNPSLVYICNPNNPTGNLISIEYIERLLLKYKGTLFLIDEAYFEFTGVTAKELILKFENLLISRTMSKAFALASFRIGYLLSCSENILAISKFRNQKNFTIFSQVASIAALSDINYMENYIEEVNLAKLQFKNFIMSMNPFLQTFNDNGNFLLIRVLEQKEKKGLIFHLEANDIFVREFTHNKKLVDCIRITVGTREQMTLVAKVIKQYFKN